MYLHPLVTIKPGTKCGFFCLIKYAAVFFVIVAIVYGAEGNWLLRWGIGALLGVFELLQIKKRKVLI